MQIDKEITARRLTRWAALRRKCRSFRALSWRDRTLIAEATIALAMARLTLRLVPFTLYVRWLRLGGSEPVMDMALASRVGRAVRVGARNVPWNAVCLPQSMAAKVMLARRGYASALYVGLTPSPDPALHAWLEVDGIVVAGGSRSTVIPVVRFG